MEISAIGRAEFVLGFQLAGVRKTIEVGKSPMEDIQALTADPEIGIVITDEETMSSLKEHERYQLERSVRPTFIVLSTKSSGQENLRKMIRKAIGVDLLRE
ncbi:MAG: V-type ATP synthase subunit F [Nanoarchaeota archaeon]|nr:V-type ATP synthase subunit F [Nanoarchaeota archaeon]